MAPRHPPIEVYEMQPGAYFFDDDSYEDVADEDVCYCSEDEVEGESSHFFTGLAWRLATASVYLDSEEPDGIDAIVDDLADSALTAVIGSTLAEHVEDEPSLACNIDAAELLPTQDSAETDEDFEEPSEDESTLTLSSEEDVPREDVAPAECEELLPSLDAPPVPEEEEGVEAVAETPAASPRLGVSRSESMLRTMAAPKKRTVIGGIRRTTSMTTLGKPMPKAGRSLAQALTASSSIRMDADDASGSEADRDSSLARGYEALGAELFSMAGPRRKSASPAAPMGQRSIVAARSAPSLKLARSPVATGATAMMLDLGSAPQRQRSQSICGITGSPAKAPRTLAPMVPYSGKSFPSLAPEGARAWKMGAALSRHRSQRVLL